MGSRTVQQVPYIKLLAGVTAMPELLIDFITSLDGYGAAEGWPGWWGYNAWWGYGPPLVTSRIIVAPLRRFGMGGRFRP